jgi:hypothetical protein
MATMNRRDWLKLFSTGVVGALVLDPEKLLWVPGEKTIFLPPVLPAREPVIYSLWQLGVRLVDLENPNDFSTVGIQGAKAFEADWREVFRTNSTVQLQEQIDKRRHAGVKEAALVEHYPNLNLYRSTPL